MFLNLSVHVNCGNESSAKYLLINLTFLSGILNMLDRNKRIKRAPEKFQQSNDIFDVIFTVEERVYDQVVEGGFNHRRINRKHLDSQLNLVFAFISILFIMLPRFRTLSNYIINYLDYGFIYAFGVKFVIKFSVFDLTVLSVVSS